jgi:hypothetical protein
VAGRTGDITLTVADITATGTPGSTTYLRGDGSWQTVTGGITRSVSTITTATTLSAAASTDYVVFSNITGTSNTDVVALLHANGINNSTTIVDDSVLVSNWTAVGDAKLTTSFKKFGTASIAFDGTGDLVRSTASLSNYQFGSSDWTIELFAYATALSGERMLIDFRGSNPGAAAPSIYLPVGSLQYYTSSASRITGATLSTGTWYHIAVCRSGTTTRMFLDGTQTGSSWTDTTSYTANTYVTVGNDGGAGSLGWAGYIDEVRISRSAKYTANFTAPTSEFINYTAPTITLPTAVSSSSQIVVKNIHATDSALLATTASQTIDGSSNLTLATGSTATLISDNTNWRTV